MSQILTTDICFSIFMVNMRTLLFSREKFSFLRDILPPLYYSTLISPTIRYFRTCFVDDGHLCFKFYGKCEDFIWIKFSFLRRNTSCFPASSDIYILIVMLCYSRACFSYQEFLIMRILLMDNQTHQTPSSWRGVLDTTLCDTVC